MVARRKDSVSSGKPSIPPATTPEGMERHLGNLAFKQVEQQLLAGTAPAPVALHFLKIVSQRNELELEKLRQENLLTEQRIKGMVSAEDAQKMFSEAMDAFRGYQGEPVDREDDDY